ncbi:hypothetical protein ACKUFS_03715 [Pseudomonas cannabina]|uniref:Uncharacterized protein n=1 Tax=Pseudomonas syringae pv. maculicola str. ES4326 TaxID=629265 RepID=A0A8T8BXI4_PSEYM|nr:MULTISPECIES: hypothetical protein [Pseudomonas syringae group]QHE95714.1 hypothetical protein PMA4326_003105 [Pseudomonas syringae pv. maculicola str. ES4326]QHE95783.1 hypothetical protein PMA4326_003535 [Pseudomonas syringae pv. maculicola str. ES4326]QQN23587.1 hypothetical protein JGS08_08170 [Pseudomonas cannabina pv. alisalensis]UBY96345.1 hypothetical protein LCG56_20515 [Pseudomonas cannabina pv. alisalensis]UBY96424.1 hypothetical protein LCG56_20960 [Pseudomonas cannabina pv. ali
MRAMDALTQNLIDSLTQLLKNPQEDALLALKICAPVLIEHLEVVKHVAVDRREIQAQLHKALDQWLEHHPQPESAQKALLTLLNQELLAKHFLDKEASA